MVINDSLRLYTCTLSSQPINTSGYPQKSAVMSITVSLTGTTSVLSQDFYPPIELESKLDYCIGLIGFHTFNAIPNIEKDVNDKFYFNEVTDPTKNWVIIIPEGAYEISDIEEYLREQLKSRVPANTPQEEVLSLKPNINTLKTEIYSGHFNIYFDQEHSFARLLGFSKNSFLAAGTKYKSDQEVDIIKVTSIGIECNIATGSYRNNTLSHVLYDFAPDVDPGVAINKEPQSVLYLPVTNKRFIDNITVRILDQEGHLLNLRGERRVVKLELKPNGYSF